MADDVTEDPMVAPKEGAPRPQVVRCLPDLVLSSQNACAKRGCEACLCKEFAATHFPGVLLQFFAAPLARCGFGQS